MRPGFLGLIAAMAGLGACPNQEVLIAVSGTLYECGDLDTCGGLDAAPVRVLDLDLATRCETVTDEDGDFRLEGVPGDSVVFLLAERWPDHVPVAFLGQTGASDGSLDDGAFFEVSLEDAIATIDAFSVAHPAGEVVQTIDPGSDGNGGMVRGRFRTRIEGLLPEDWPGRDRLSCHFQDSDGERFPCVYLDADGNPDWSLETTTFDGGFAAFGIPQGLHTGVLLDGVEDEASRYALFHAYVPEDGIAVFDHFTSPF